MTLDEHWPLIGLRVKLGSLDLRLPTDDELAALADVAVLGVHPPEQMPFVFPWTDTPPDQLPRRLLQYHWEQRATWSPEAWNLELGVFLDGEPIGFQSIGSRRFDISRTVVTGSWLGQSFQRQGHGRRMRAAVLELAFAGLGALEARSGAIEGNVASQRVSEQLGYVRDGTQVHVVRDQRRIETRYRLDRAAWERHRTGDVQIQGLEPCLALFGAAAPPG